MTTFSDNVTIQGDLKVTGTTRVATSTGVKRADLIQDNLQAYHIRPEDWRVWDAMNTPLPAAAANDDLGIIGGTFATGSPTIQAGDLKNAGATTRYARCTFALPPEYNAGETVVIRVHAGMLTTVASVSATADLQVYKCDEEAGISADLCATAAIDINSVTLADKDFTITSTALAPGDLLDIRLAIAVNDSGTGTAVTAIVGAAKVLLDIQG